MSAFIKTLQNTASRHSLWKRGSKIIIGVSGGPDSTCLLDVCASLSKKYDWQLHIAHVNYGLRKKDSDKDESFVRDIAHTYNIPCSVLKVKVKQKANLEEYLRDIRYQFFDQLRKKLKYDIVAIAHTQNDQAETVLMRLLRGSGLSGLGAMRHKTGHIIRPMLDTNRKDVLEYLKKHSLRYRIDTSNKDIRFLRNKIRHRLIPYLEKNFNPSIQKTLANTAETVAIDYETLVSLETSLPIKYTLQENIVSFLASEFLLLSPSVQKRVIRHFYTMLHKHTRELEMGHVNECLKMLQSTKSKAKTISFLGLKIMQKGDTVTITLV